MIPYISIIIPAHNSGCTIERCIGSISNNGFKDLEIIVVDDQSSDNTLDVLHRLASQDQRIKILTTKGRKGGASCARNVGLKFARGEYVTFSDSDDYLSTDIYEKIVPLLQQYHPDFLDFNFCDSVDGVIAKHKENKVEKNTLLDRAYLEKYIFPSLVNIQERKDHYIELYIWNKLFKRSIIEANTISFDEDRKKWEDKPFLVKFCSYSNTFCSTPYDGYYYCISNTSLSRSKDPKLLNTVILSIEEYIKYFGHIYNFDEEYPVSYYCRRLSDVALGQVESFGDNESYLCHNLQEVFSRNSAQHLFSLFQPSTRFEFQMKQAILSHKCSRIISIARCESRRRIFMSWWRTSFPRKVLNYLSIHVLGHEL